MVRMKLSKDEFDPKALDVKVDEPKFQRYRGEIPRNGTILIFRVTKMWWTQAKDGTSQIYVLAIAEQNKGSLKEFNGLPIREYLTFKPEAAFRYMNFLNTFGLTTRDIYNKMDVEPEPDNIGDIINSIAGWEVGSDDALCRVALIRDRYDPDELKAKADRDGWMPLEDDDVEDSDEDEDEPPARPSRSRSTQGQARGARAASSRGRRAEPEPEEDEDEEEDIDEDEDEDVEDEDEEQEEDEDEEQEEPPARPTRGRPQARGRSSQAGRRASTTSRRSTARTERTPGPRGSRSRDGGSTEEPPF